MTFLQLCDERNIFVGYTILEQFDIDLVLPQTTKVAKNMR